MSILITGGKGFIGSQLESYLRGGGHEIVLFNGDISNIESVKNFTSAKQIRAVIHLAATVSSRSNSLYEKTNIIGTSNILYLCQKLNVERLIFLSSLRVLSSIKDPYIDSKRQAEKMIVGSGVPYIILRPSMVYGPNDKKNIGFLLKIIKEKHLVPALDFVFQPLFLKDLLRVIEVCLTVLPNKVFNVPGGQTLSFGEFLNFVGDCGYKFKIFGWPKINHILIKIFSYFPFSPVIPSQVDSLFSKEVFNERSWSRELNIKETFLKDGLKKILSA
ncbi:MAG: NAD(P)-dependent oxidoreductase [Patescibacteria group bacterium]